ncbi:3D domain-containing protein [Alkalibaculum bacchi]|uniref:3D domain-containing protein n=1 Tax=Alkalibaculum bacchi TaxID=645887 RepID=UPI0026EC8466|nr:3D domain-containing protein [Alkalibaculum bacchi]
MSLSKIKGLMHEKKLIIGIIFFLLTMTLFILFGKNDIIVKVDHEEVSASFRGTQTVEQVLKNQNISLKKEDKVEPALHTELEDGDIIEIQRAIPIIVVADGTEHKINTTLNKVEDVLGQLELQVDENDKVEPSLSSTVNKENNSIKIVRVEEKIEVKETSLDYKKIEKKNSNLLQGKTNLVQRGSTGLKTIEEKVILEDNAEVSREVISENIKKPVDEIKEIGTKVPVNKIVTSSNKSVPASRGDQSSVKTITVEATAYYVGNRTASGTNPSANRTIAASSNYSFGTKMYIPALGNTYVVEDRGGAVTGNKIDIYFNTREECVRFGRKTLQVQVLQ